MRYISECPLAVHVWNDGLLVSFVLQRIAVEMDRCNEAVMSCRSSFSHNHRPRSAVTLSAASRRKTHSLISNSNSNNLIYKVPCGHNFRGTGGMVDR